MTAIKYNKERLYQHDVTIYTEANPNPNSMKFMFNFMLLEAGESIDFPSAEEAQLSPLVQALFGFSYVERVFMMSNFITITKNEEAEWQQINTEIRGFLKNWFDEKKPIFDDAAADELSSQSFDTEIVQRIKSILDEYIKPAVEMDGGAIQFHTFDEESGVLTVQLQGSCSGCPSSTVTLKQGIENLMKRMVPTVKEVIAEGV